MNEWIKKHKKEIAIGTVGAVGAGLLFYKFGIKTPTNPKDKEVEQFVNTLMNDGYVNMTEKPKLNIAEVTDYWTSEFGPGMILNDFTIADIGKLGEDLLANIEGITEDTIITASMDLLINNNK